MSEQMILEATSDTRTEEPGHAEGAAAPRSNGEAQESPQAEAVAEEAEAEETEAEEAEASEDTVTPSAEEGEQAGQQRKRRRRRRGRRRTAAAEDIEVKVIPPKKIIKPLRRGMEVEGTVRRLADFGAFIDIGVGTDGLVHISELSATRVGKVGDVLREGQTVTAWIKDLDREHNRISLTMISPGTKTIRNLEEGEVVQGTVTRLAPYGAFIDIGVGRDAMLHVREMGEGYVAKPEDIVQIGQAVEARVIAVDRRRQRIDLSFKGLRAEPAPVQFEQPAAPEPVFEPVREESEVEIPSVMAFAFQRAFGDDFKQEQDQEPRRDRKQKRRRRDREEYDEEIEEIMSRTLRYRGER